jgi:hypothetical protein
MQSEVTLKATRSGALFQNPALALGENEWSGVVRRKMDHDNCVIPWTIFYRILKSRKVKVMCTDL